MQTIDREARERIQSPIDFDNFSDRYITNNGLFIFTSPSMWAIERNFYYLLANSSEKSFQVKYKMKPSYLSIDEYGTPILSNLLMRINGIFCIEDFNMDKVIIPSISAITELCRDKNSNSVTLSKVEM